jgi:hypothetical protein
LSVTTHFAVFDGDTNRLAAMEQGPVSDHVFLPVEMDFTNHVNGVFDFFAVTVFSTLKPGLTTIGSDEETLNKP